MTGGTDGIGRAVALQLAERGHSVLIVGRDADRGREAIAALRARHPQGDHVFIAADLSMMAETALVADEVARRTSHLDAAVFCAGILSTLPEWTTEGLERTFALNYLTRYLMIRHLLPALHAAPSGRIVLVSNAGKYADTLDFDDLQHRRGKPGLNVSGRSQFANDLMAIELNERLRGTRVQATCVFPGVSRTAVFRNARGLPWIARLLASVVQRLVGLSPAMAAETPVFLAHDTRAAASGGRFFGPRCKELPVPERARQQKRRSTLWTLSEDLVRPHLPHAAP